jgi:hypothetical protein
MFLVLPMFNGPLLALEEILKYMTDFMTGILVIKKKND